MAYHVVDNFVRGLDVRRPLYAMQAGAVFVLTDAHVTRGATIEQRKAFVEQHTLTSTKGLGKLNNAPCVFSHGGRPLGLNADVEFQQIDPGNGTSLTSVDSIELFDGLMYVVATFSDGAVKHFYDGALVTDWFDGRARASFDVTAGSNGAANKVSSVKVNGVEILGADVLWTTSHAATAAAIAAQIESYTSSPEYNAVAVGPTVVIKAPASLGDTANGYTVQFTVGGDLTLSAPSAMSSGQPAGGSYTPGTYAKTHGSKVYSPSGPLLHFCGIDGPTGWNPEEDDGAGAINFANNAAGSEELRAAETYIGYLAVWAKNAIQIWSMAADPLNNAHIQTIPEYGTVAARTVKSFGESDIFFLDNEMIRSLRPSSVRADYAVIRDPAAPIAKTIRAQVKATPSATVTRALAVTEPVERRLWMCVGNKVFVYTSFEEEKIKAWSVYSPGFTITDAVVIDEKLWLRGDDNQLYLYGGEEGDTYDDTDPVVVLPAAHLGSPASDKLLTGLDVGVEGRWVVTLYQTPDDYAGDRGEVIWRGDGPTYWKPDMGVQGLSTHAVFKFEGDGDGFKELVNLAIHYEPDDAP